MNPDDVDCSAYGPVERQGRSISSILAENRVVKIYHDKDAPNLFVVTEMCDDYFSVTLTREQILEWIEELMLIVGGETQ